MIPSNGSNPSAQGAPPRTAYSLAEVAASLGISYEQARALAKSGQLRSIPAGRYVRIPVPALADFLRIPVAALADFLRTGTSA